MAEGHPEGWSAHRHALIAIGSRQGEPMMLCHCTPHTHQSDNDLGKHRVGRGGGNGKCHAVDGSGDGYRRSGTLGKCPLTLKLVLPVLKYTPSGSALISSPEVT